VTRYAGQSVERADDDAVARRHDDDVRLRSARQAKPTRSEGPGKIGGRPRRSNDGANRRQVEAKSRSALTSGACHGAARRSGRQRLQHCAQDVQTPGSLQMAGDRGQSADGRQRLAEIEFACSGDCLQAREGIAHVQRSSLWADMGDREVPMMTRAARRRPSLFSVLDEEPGVRSGA